MCSTRIYENTLMNVMGFVVFIFFFFFLIFYFRRMFVSRNNKVILNDIATILVSCFTSLPFCLIFVLLESILYSDNKCLAKGCFDGNIIYNSILFFLIPLFVGIFLYEPIHYKYKKLSGSKKEKFKKYLAVGISIFVVIILILYLNFILYGSSFDIC